MNNNNINIANILRDMPKGTKLYSPVCGVLMLDEVTPNGIFCVQPNGIDNGKRMVFMEDGHLKNYNDWADRGECLLFPSNEMRDWSKFFKRGDVVLNLNSEMYAIFSGWVDDTYTEFNTTHCYECKEMNFSTKQVCSIEYFELAMQTAKTYLIKVLERKYHGKYNPDTLEVESVKSLPKYRPFNNAEECWGEMQKHKPFGWISFTDNDGYGKAYQNILIVNYKGIIIDFEEATLCFNKCFNCMIFADGSVFGIME